MSDVLLALAARVEGSEQASREIDAEIWLAMTPGATRSKTIVPDHEYDGKLRSGWTIDETRENGRLIIVPAYTSSLDDAATLVPGRVSFQLDFVAGGSWPGRAYVNDKIFSPACNLDFKFKGIGKTLALAMTAACLRARAAQAIEARRVETERLDAQHESAVAKPCAQGPAS